MADQEDIKDLVQDIFIKAYTNIQSFDTTRRFSPWLYRVAHNEFINEVKKKSRQSFFSIDFDIFFPHPEAKETSDENINQEYLKLLIESSLSQIDVKYREPLILYFLEELSYKEISDILQIPVSTVGVRLQRGKKLLKNLLKKTDIV